MVKNIKYKKSTIDNDIYTKVLSDVTLPYLKVYTDNDLNTTNNETEFPELTIVFEERFEMRFQEGYVLKYLIFRICQSPIRISIDQTDYIMDLVNKWFPTGKFRKVDTTFRTDSTFFFFFSSALRVPMACA